MSAHTPQLAVIVRRFTARYRAALLKKAALLAVLGGAALAVLGWRLSALPRAPRWSLGVLCAAGAMAAAGLAWWLHRRWVSDRSGAAYLDRTLGLQQRLVTAEEFAQADPPPALYPLLMEDASLRASVNGSQFPKSFDRTAAVLAALLLIVLMWPIAGRSPLQQLASLPKSLRPPEPPPQATPPEPTQDPRQQQQQQNSQSPQPSQGGGQDQQQSGQSQSDASGQQGQSGSPQQPQQGAADSRNGEQKSGEEQQQTGQSDGQARTDGQQQQDGTRKPGDDGRQQQDSAKQSGASQQAGRQGQQQADGRQQQQQASGREGGSGKQPSGAPDTKQASTSPQGGQSGAMSPGSQEALKAEIQELLKEVSGELKELQQQLAAEQRNAPPSIGNQTDPELFESPMALDPATGEPVPMNLQTDDAAVKDPRTGGGSGTPGREVLSDAPQAVPEDARLSDTPSEEQAAGRQVVPPEYRNVFDRLNREESP